MVGILSIHPVIVHVEPPILTVAIKLYSLINPTDEISDGDELIQAALIENPAVRAPQVSECRKILTVSPLPEAVVIINW